MNPNPLLKKLGLPKDARAIIFHADDIGMCQASITAFQDLFSFGLVRCGSVMVSCPWFPGAASLGLQNPEMDLGVHLTLTSEWRDYRWRPLSTCEPGSGLLDSQGFFHQCPAPVQLYADPHAVELEISAQVECARKVGMDLTHVDTHMFILSHPRLIGSYLRIASAFRVPPLLVRAEDSGYRALGMDEESAAFSAKMAVQLEESGFPLMDALMFLPNDHPEDRIKQIKTLLSQAPQGITHFFIHPALDTPELRAITPYWSCRVADYQAFLDEGLRKWVLGSGLILIGYREIKKAIYPG